MSPSASVASAETLAAGLPKLLLAAERLAFVAAPGLHGRRRAGPGEAFWQFRDWQAGDEVRRIDWRRSAIGERVFIRQQESQAQAGFRLRLHDSPGMAFRGARTVPTKRERAVLLLLALAALLLRSGERVALDGVTAPLAGGAALQHLAAALAIGGAAGTAASDKRARRIDFGDFLSPGPAFAPPKGGAVLQILDPAECDFPYAGRVIFEDFTAAPALEAPNAAAWRSAYHIRLAAQQQAVAEAARAAGQTPLFHRTDAAPAAALLALYQALLQA